MLCVLGVDPCLRVLWMCEICMVDGWFSVSAGHGYDTCLNSSWFAKWSTTIKGADADSVPLVLPKPLLLEGRASASERIVAFPDELWCTWEEAGRRNNAPMLGWFKCNVDASRFVMDESVGFAAVIRDSYGPVLRSFTGRMEGLIGPLLPEAIAIREFLGLSGFIWIG